MKTILAYHDKQKEHYGILDKTLPLLVHERYEPFLLTTKELFTIQLHEIQNRAREYPIKNTIKSIKTTFSSILLIPGIVTAIMYILDFITAVAKQDAPPPILPSWLTNLTFWIAVWGAMILWHETYKTLRIKGRIAECPPFTDHDIKIMKGGDFGLSKRVNRDIFDVLDHETEKILLSSVHGGKIDMLQLLSLLLDHEHSQTILDRIDITDTFEHARTTLLTPKAFPSYDLGAARSLLVYATEEAILSGSPTVRPEHVFLSFFKLFETLTQFLRKNSLNIELMRYAASWIQMQEAAIHATQLLNPAVPYLRTGGIAQSWIYGYTFILSKYSKDLTLELARKGGHFGIGHEQNIEEIFSTIGKTTNNNVLLVGESGTGKTSIVKGVAERINRGTVPPAIKNMRVIQLDINGLVAAGPQYGNLETLIKQTMSELQKAGNTILFIDEMQEIVGVQGEESKHSLAGMILPYVLDSTFPIIGTMTYADYKKYFYSRESLRQSFENIEIAEVTPQAAFNIILTRLSELETTYGLKITFPAILEAVELAQRYVNDRKLPDSAVNVIESACSSAQAAGVKILTSKLIADTVATMTNIPVQEVSAEEATTLLGLEEKIRSKVIGQDEAVHQIVEALKRARTDIRDKGKPIGSFLFLGPTGVGKTYLAKTVGEEYFGEKHKMIRLDMSEFKDVASISRLIGTAVTSELSREGLTFLDEVKINPFSVILLDEMEKAHPQVLDLFLQVLDEGHMTNSAGETISFDNAIIIATSNIGSKTLLDALEKDQSMFEEAKERVLLELRTAVRVEFLNRFDQIIVFSPHNKENLTKIAELLLKELRTRMREKEITLDWEDSIPKLVARDAFEPGLGARPMKRFIQEHFETALAERILNKSLNAGDTFTITQDMMK